MTDSAGPVELIEDPYTGDRFLIYGTEHGAQVELRYQGDTLWMTQAQIAEAFGRDVSVVSRHIFNILQEGELAEEGNLQKVQITRFKPTVLYSLDMVISVGYRVNSTQATMFRQWATEKLVRFATQGFVIDADRLKDPAARGRLAELREIIRDIRSDEKNVYRELREICAMCQDYAGDSEAWREFYRKTQAKLMWAVTSETPSEIVFNRVDVRQPDMGLQSWSHDRIRKSDAGVAKNYLTKVEIKELNRLTTILLDIFEDQLDIGRLVTMADANILLDKQLANLNRAVLTTGGSISSSTARDHANRQYLDFDQKRKDARHAQADRDLADLKEASKSLPRSNPRPTRKR